MEKKKAVLTIKDVANYLGVHTSTIYRYAQDGKIPAFKIGSDWRFHRKYIDRWIDGQITSNGKKQTWDSRLETRASQYNEPNQYRKSNN